MADIMTAKELSRYLKFHEVTICKFASSGQIPARRMGRFWRFDKDKIDEWIRASQNDQKTDEKSQRKGVRKNPGKKKSKK